MIEDAGEALDSAVERSPDLVYEDETIRISGLEGGDAALFVAFTGIGHRMGALQREEFVNISRDGGRNSVLFVQDKTRSWYNDPTFVSKLVPAVAGWRTGRRKLVTIGNSMGGFGAIVFAGALQADVAIAFSPQLSVSTQVVPEENRWSEFVSGIKNFVYESAADHIGSGSLYYLFQGDAGKDRFQIDGFPVLPNVRQFVVPDGPHNLATVLKSHGALAPIVAACVAGDLAGLRDILQPTGALLRTAETPPFATRVRERRPIRTDAAEQLEELKKLASGGTAPAELRARKRLLRKQARLEEKKAERFDRRQAEWVAANAALPPAAAEETDEPPVATGPRDGG